MGIKSVVGVRKNNQDYVDYYESEKCKVYVVADGMGGHNGGEIASKLAVEKVIEKVRENEVRNDIANVLREAIEYANEKIYRKANEDITLEGMGTTITACIIKNGAIFMANVGDSSGMVYYDNEITKITKDHSFVQELIDLGKITEDEARYHPNRNIITRSLGGKVQVEVDIKPVNSERVEKIILCTDGLSGVVSLEEMAHVIRQHDNETSSEKLIELAEKNESKDNISVMIVEGECC